MQTRKLGTGHKVGPGFAVYAATKHAVRALSEGLRQEVKPYNIRTTVISPGAVATELPNSVTDPDAAARIRQYYAEAAIPANSFAGLLPSPSANRRRWTSTRSCSGPRARNCESRLGIPALSYWTQGGAQCGTEIRVPPRVRAILPEDRQCLLGHKTNCAGSPRPMA